MGYDAGRWVDEPILPELPAPPAHLVQVRGAQLVAVRYVDPAGRRRGEGDAVILAWAPLPAGGWAVLVAWIGAWQQNNRTTGAPRWAWCRYDKDLVRPAKPSRPLVEREGFEWHGWHRDSDLAEAVRQAAASLPEHLREAALTPRRQP